MYEYHVIRKCFYNSNLYEAGDVIIRDTEIKPLPSSMVDVTPIAEEEVGVLFRFIKRPEPVAAVEPVKKSQGLTTKILDFFKGN